MKKISFLIFLGLILFSCNQSKPDRSLAREIDKIVKSKKADVGVAILGIENKESFSYKGNEHFPMQSVYKFHLALAVFNRVDEGSLSLNQLIDLNENNLLPKTWSPLREKYIKTDTSVTLMEVLDYTVSESDNNGCDILFGLLGGPLSVNSFIHQQGFNDISIVATEQEMHQDWEIQFTNWSTPLTTARLLEKFYHKKILSDSSTLFMLKMMTESKTGPERIKGELPAGTIVAHKTGSSGQSKDGITAALNDIGIVTLPNGNHFVITVFITNSAESKESNEKIISEISLAAFNYFEKY